MIKEYNIREQSQQKKTPYNAAFVENSFQFVSLYFTKSERLVIGALMTYMDYDTVYPSQETLAIKAGVSPRTVWETVRKMRSLNLISCKHRMNNSLIYTLSSAFYLKSVRSALRPLMSSFFLAISLMVSASTPDLPTPCELTRITELFNSSSSLFSLKKSLFSLLKRSLNTKILNQKHLPFSQLSVKEQRMRILIKDAQRYVHLSSADIELLDTLPDTAIKKALERVKKAQKIEHKTAYFMKIAQYEAGMSKPKTSYASDNGNGVNGIESKLSLKNGYFQSKSYKSFQKQGTAQVQKKSVSSSTILAHKSNNTVEEIEYALVDHDLFVADMHKKIAAMNEFERQLWKSLWGDKLPPTPYKLPNTENNKHLFKNDPVFMQTHFL